MKTKLPLLVALLMLGAMTYATPSQAALVEGGCPNTDDEYRTGNAQCVFSCGGSDTVSVTASSNQVLTEIDGKANCGGAAAHCNERSSKGCTDGSNGLTTRAQSEGACKATGFDPWFHGAYTLTANCTGNTWQPPSEEPPGGCIDLGGDCLDLDVLCINFNGDCLCLDFNDCPIAMVHMEATIIDGIVVQVIGIDLVTGQSFVPVVSIEQTLDGLMAITIST